MNAGARRAENGANNVNELVTAGARAGEAAAEARPARRSRAGSSWASLALDRECDRRLGVRARVVEEVVYDSANERGVDEDLTGASVVDDALGPSRAKPHHRSIGAAIATDRGQLEPIGFTLERARA